MACSREQEVPQVQGAAAPRMTRSQLRPPSPPPPYREQIHLQMVMQLLMLTAVLVLAVCSNLRQE